MFGKRPSAGDRPSQPPKPEQTPPSPPANKMITGPDYDPTQASTTTAGNNAQFYDEASARKEEMAPPPAAPAQEKTKILSYTDKNLETKDYAKVKTALIQQLIEKADFDALERLPDHIKKDSVFNLVNELLQDVEMPLNNAQQERLREHVLDEIFGFGPLEPLLNDPDVSDIMINSSNQIYLEKNGKIFLSDITFTSETHLLNVVQRIVSLVGRRVDEVSPMVDARMPDGSRFNAIIPPISLDGSLVSIRKFKKNKMPLSQYVDYGSMSTAMAKFLEICANIRLNIMISGGTGSGKTTMLNALSGHIDEGERVITIEDAAELQLHQPHVLRLETRPPNSEGRGEITQRQLLKNALRMRPDRIILGEIRGDEVVDVLAAMNTGHDGSMATIHSNSPRDCLSRIENLVGLAGMTLPTHALRQQIASALHLIVQVSRMRDGGRRVTQIEEIVGLEGDVITTQTLFQFKSGPMGPDGKLTGEFIPSGIRPRFYEQAEYFGREKELDECISPRPR